MVSMYCVKCRAKKQVDESEVQRVTMKNNKPAMKAPCPDCGTTMFRIGG